MSKPIKTKLRDVVPTEIPELLMPHIELCSDRKAVVEGCKGILEYTGECIRLNCKNRTVSFKGENLSLCTLLNEQITVTGKISALTISL